MSEYFPHTPIVPKMRHMMKVAAMLPLILTLSLLVTLSTPTPSQATVLARIHFEWIYDTTQPDLMGYMIYQETQPIININNPNTLTTDVDVYLEPGQQNSFTIKAYDNLGKESDPSPPYIIDVPSEDISGNIPPVANIEISSVSGPAPLTIDVNAGNSIDYDGIIISYVWNFGDGGVSSYEQDSHTFDIPGTYVVILNVTDNSGALSTAQTTVTVTDPQATPNQPPTPLIYTTTNSGSAPLDVLFDGTDSTDSDGTIIDYSWDFGDGNSDNGIFVNYTYHAIGTFTGKLTVTDDNGASASDQTVITVAASDPFNKPPLAVINANPLTGAIPLTTTFSGAASTDSDGVVMSYNWDFGDGSTASGVEVTHSYAAAGTYTATLTVTDEIGDTGQAKVIISASEELLPSTTMYTDDFSTDTSSSYTNINGKLSVENGTAHGADWQITFASHNLSLGTSDHWVEAVVTYNGLSSSAGLLARVDTTAKTGYTAYFSAGKINLNRFVGTSQSWLASADGPYGEGTYALRMVVTGSTIQVYVNGVLKIQKTDTTYAHGLQTGLRIHRGIDNADVTVDNLMAGIGSPPRFSQQNTPPVVQNTSFTTQENSTVSGTFIVSDLDGDPLTTSIVNNGTLGKATITNPLTGSYSYTPNQNVFGTDTFTYKANDGLADSNVGTITVTINKVVSVSGVTDAFSTDTSGNYTAISGAITIADGKAHGQQWTDTRVFHNSSLESADQFVEADVYYSGASQGAGLLARIDPELGTGYLAYFEGNNMNLASVSGSTKQWLERYSGSYTAGTYKLRMETEGSTIRIFVNGKLVLEKQDTKYAAGNHVGLRFNQGSSTADMRLDNLTAGMLAATASPSAIGDAFSTDTSNNYTAISGAITIADGKAHGQQWADTRVFHNSSLASDDQFVEADVYYSGASQGAGLLARIDPELGTGYLAYFEGNNINLASVSDSTKQWLERYNGSYAAGTYKLRMETEGSTIRIFVNGKLVLEKQDTKYAAGKHAGLRFNQGAADADMYADNLAAGELAANIFSTDVEDNFSTNTAANYTTISGALTIADGKAHGQQWADTRVFHNSSLESADQFVEADVYYSGASQGAGLLARIDPELGTGYLAYFEGNNINLASVSDSTKQWLERYSGSYAAGTYKLRMETKGSTIRIFVNGKLVLEKQDTRYATGKHVGLRFNQGAADADMFADNLTAGILKQ